jgi:hypothetical protein
MALSTSLSVPQADEGVRAAFLRNHHGRVCIAFSDPAFVRSDSIVIDPKDFAVYAILHEAAYFISRVSETMARAFAESDEALLTAVRPDGHVFELTAPVQVGH